MKCEIVSVGTELLMGQIANTDAQFLSRELREMGIPVYYHTVVGDNPARLAEQIRESLSRSDILILTGGLGPTPDDLTKETAAEVLGLALVEDDKSLREMEAYFARIGAVMTENNKKQIFFPMGSRILPNPNGTAPGCLMEQDGKCIVILPGPPRELNPMFLNHVKPYLLEHYVGGAMVSRFIHVFGIGESRMADMLGDRLHASNPTLATYVGNGDIILRATAAAPCEEEAERMLDPVTQEVCAIFGDAVVSLDGRELNEVVVALLREKGKTLSCAESCTGGMIASSIVDVSGSSEVFLEGCVTYSNEAKMRRLGVREETLSQFGAVSARTAAEMAEGMRQTSGSDYALATTGIAGPTGGTPEKPVGLVYVALATPEGTKVLERNQNRSRALNRRGAMLAALDLLRKELLSC